MTNSHGTLISLEGTGLGAMAVECTVHRQNTQSSCPGWGAAPETQSTHYYSKHRGHRSVSNFPEWFFKHILVPCNLWTQFGVKQSWNTFQCKTILQHILTPSPPQHVKFPGWKIHACTENSIFSSLIAYLFLMLCTLMKILSHASAKKEEKRLKIWHF